MEITFADTPSGLFQGWCFRDENCANVCRQEGKRSGHCSTWLVCWCEN
ncbi:hypothetical protein Mgra_00004824 [Meloidogyne graminicola]|uniref:Knottins-like domain-containing protein n=1 Tax=Meloidogyne graminicola TaxID=189291 RepID=A0A8S9ZR73_9BILA|nr:hypothetical protein Mgra_00004824 [Meloidogyne graminicola]